MYVTKKKSILHIMRYLFAIILVRQVCKYKSLNFVFQIMSTTHSQGRTLGGVWGGCDTPPSFLKYVEKFGPESWLERRKSVRRKSEKVNILWVEKEKFHRFYVHTQLHKPRYET